MCHKILEVLAVEVLVVGGGLVPVVGQLPVVGEELVVGQLLVVCGELVVHQLPVVDE